MARKRLQRWIAKAYTRLNDAGGCLGVLFFLASCALTVLAIILQQATFVVVSIAICILFLIHPTYILISSWPSELDAEQLRNRKMTIDKLEQLPSHCVKVAFVGGGQTGKTTLIDHLASLTPSNIHTIAPEMVVINAPNPVGLIALLDAAGEDITQQFEIIDRADFLVVLLDHNKSRTEARPSKDRKSELSHAISDLINKLQQRRITNKPIRAIHVLRNKHDLWGQRDSTQWSNLKTWFDEQVARLRICMPPDTVSDDNHSNERTADISRVRAKIQEIAALIVTT